MKMISFWTVILSSVIRFVSPACNVDTGPAGGQECVLLTPYYKHFQWGTCLTDVYIQTKSEGRHQCKDRSNTYCYYQCMIELHNDNGSGPVFDDCACSPNGVNTTTPAPLPPWCFSPSGDNCSWYRECLARYQPCHDSNAEYAISFAEHFCKLYDKFSHHFSQSGKKWINAVRKCLQVQLVPILRPWIHKSCEDINQMALESHSVCFKSPANGVNYCSLSNFQLFQIFFTLKSELENATEDTVGKFYDITTECMTSSTDNDKINQFKTFQFELQEILLKKHRNRRSSDQGRNINSKKLIQEFVATVAANQQWKEQGIIWYGRQSKNNSSNLIIDFIIASQREFDLNSGDNIPSANVTSVVDKLKEDLQSGKLHFQMINKTVLSMNVCDDLGCRITHNEATVTGGKVTQSPEENTSVDLETTSFETATESKPSSESWSPQTSWQSTESLELQNVPSPDNSAKTLYLIIGFACGGIILLAAGGFFVRRARRRR